MRRLFGMPGGGSNADLVDAAGRGGLPFSLAHTETASAFMAAAQAEITGKLGACIATLGPGAASVMNGVAHAFLDRVPLLVLTDCYGESAARMGHQNLAQGAMFRPVVKWSARLRPGRVRAVLEEAIDMATTPPAGPVHLDVASEVTRAAVAEEPDERPGRPAQAAGGTIPAALAEARRPVFLLGLGARTPAIAAAVRGMCARFAIPALVTYKAKGVVPDRHPWFGGVLTNGALERDILARADVFVAVGLDPVELLPRPWEFRQPVVSLTEWAMNQRQIPLAAELVGDVVGWLEAVAALRQERTDWQGDEVFRLAEAQRARMRVRGECVGLLPHRVVELVASAYPGARATVDAGAHMFPVMTFWPVAEPGGLLISNGLATMGFGLPSAVGAALLNPPQVVVAFTGDGGLLMCLGELRTAVREGLRLRIIVFDDGELSLIKVKQMERGYAADSASIGRIDWRAIGAGMGVAARAADSEEALQAGIEDTVDEPGPVLIAAKIAAATYRDTIRALRG